VPASALDRFASPSILPVSGATGQDVMGPGGGQTAFGFDPNSRRNM
jgi:hypothetical protein